MEDNCLSGICRLSKAHGMLTQTLFVKAASCLLIFENTRIFIDLISLVMGTSGISMLCPCVSVLMSMQIQITELALDLSMCPFNDPGIYCVGYSRKSFDLREWHDLI